MEIGIDIGGTFTDVVLVDGDRLLAAKLSSVPGQPDVAFGHALQHAAGVWSVDLAKLDRLVHGTTVGTNILLERTAPPVGLLTTKGFRDVLDVGRQNRRELYNLNITRTDRDWLCPRACRVEIDERIDKSGDIVTALDPAAVLSAVDVLLKQGVSAIAICFLFSFVNPAHEDEAAALIRTQWPDLPVSLSHLVDPQFREYERTLTTLVDAYLKPDVTAYVQKLNDVATSLGIGCPIEIARSRGAVTRIASVVDKPVELTLSGPAAAVAGAAAEIAQSEFRDVITIDIGGTSADIALVRDGKVLLRHDGEIGDLSVRCAMADVSAIGAGGGSIASVQGGMLTVGPRSAGSNPGPVAYGRGGVEPTITDASLVLGYMQGEGFAGSGLRFDVNASRRAITDKIAKPLGVDLETAALGMHRVLNARMAESIRLITVKRGIDPRRCALMPLGGGGGLHASALAGLVGIRAIIAPPLPGVMAALGLLRCPVEHAEAQAIHRRLDEIEPSLIASIMDRLRVAVALRIDADVADGLLLRETVAFDCCFQGQSNNLSVVFEPGQQHSLTSAIVADRFRRDYHALFRQVPSAPVMLIRIEVILTGQRVTSTARIEHAGDRSAARKRMIRLQGSEVRSAARLVSRADLHVQAMAGPLIVEQADCTLLFEAGWQVACDSTGFLIARRTATNVANVAVPRA